MLVQRLVLDLEERLAAVSTGHALELLGVQLKEPLLHLQAVFLVLLVVGFVDEAELQNLITRLHLLLRDLEFLGAFAAIIASKKTAKVACKL